MELSWALRGTTYGRGRDSDASGPWTFRVAGRAVGHIHSDERGDLPDMITIANLVAGDVRRGGPPLPALSHVSLTIDPGFFALLGPSGAGKSTLLRVLATLQPPDAGDATIAGHSVRGDRLGVRRLIGYVPQVARFYPDLRVLRMLRYLAGLSGLRGRVLDARCEEALALVHLTGYGRERIKHLSGGLCQRLAIAQALVHRPEVLLADEPGSGLDPDERAHLLTLLSDLALGRTVVLATHLVADIAPVCTQLAVLHAGRLRFVGTPGALAERARGRVWEQLLSDQELARALVGPGCVAGVARVAGGMLARLVGDDRDGLRPVVGQPTLEEGYLAVIGKGGRACA